jgi:hypothetical protein
VKYVIEFLERRDFVHTPYRCSSLEAEKYHKTTDGFF